MDGQQPSQGVRRSFKPILAPSLVRLNNAKTPIKLKPIPPPPYVTSRAPHFTRDDTDIHPHYHGMEWNHVSIERNIPFFPPFQFIVVSLQEINNNTKKKNSDTCPFLFLLSLSLLPFNALLFLGDGVRRAMHSTRPSTMLIGIEVSRTTTTFHQLCRSTTDRPPRTRE